MGLYNRDYMRDADEWRERRAWFADWSPVTIIISLCLAVFVVQLFLAPALQFPLPVPGSLSWEALKNGELWRLVTFNFLHAHPVHLLVNMVLLWMVGHLAREATRPLHVVAIFLLGGAVGGVVNCLVYREAQLVGASAGFYALFLAMAGTMPHRPVGFPFLPGLTVQLKNLAAGVIIFDMISAGAQMVGPQESQPATAEEAADKPKKDHVASLSHLAGAVAGFLYGRFILAGFASLVRESERRERAVRDDRQRRREPSRVAAGRQPLALPPPPPEPPSLSDYLQDVVDPILEKMHAHGPQSLSAEERRVLGEAADRLKKGGRS